MASAVDREDPGFDRTGRRAVRRVPVRYGRRSSLRAAGSRRRRAEEAWFAGDVDRAVGSFARLLADPVDRLRARSALFEVLRLIHTYGELDPSFAIAHRSLRSRIEGLLLKVL